jgi:hypothetical protein
MNKYEVLIDANMHALIYKDFGVVPKLKIAKVAK